MGACGGAIAPAAAPAAPAWDRRAAFSEAEELYAELAIMATDDGTGRDREATGAAGGGKRERTARSRALTNARRGLAALHADLSLGYERQRLDQMADLKDPLHRPGPGKNHHAGILARSALGGLDDHLDTSGVDEADQA